MNDVGIPSGSHATTLTTFGSEFPSKTCVDSFIVVVSHIVPLYSLDLTRAWMYAFDSLVMLQNLSNILTIYRVNS